MLGSQVWRYITAAECIAIFSTFALLATAFRTRNGIDYTLRCLALMLAFFVAAAASLAATERHTAVHPEQIALTFVLGFVLATLTTPWRWPAAWRAHRRTPPS